MTKDEAVTRAIYFLLEECPERKGDFFAYNDSPNARRVFLEDLIIRRKPTTPNKAYLSFETAILSLESKKRGVIDCFSVPSTEYAHIGLLRGDILQTNADVLVVPTGETLLGSVSPQSHELDREVHSRSGVRLRYECQKALRQHPSAKAIITPSFNLSCRSIVHVVAPMINGRPSNADIKQLRKCYELVLDLAVGSRASFIAIPPISAGYHGFHLEEAAKIAVEAVDEYMNEHPSCPNVIFVVPSEEQFVAYDSLLHSI